MFHWQLLLHNTPYNLSIECCPSSFLYGREPTKPLDFCFLTDAKKKRCKNQSIKKIIHCPHSKDMMIRHDNDPQTIAQTLKLPSFCLLLNRLVTTQSDLGSKSLQNWIQLYRVKFLKMKSNFIIWKVGTVYPEIFSSKSTATSARRR